MGAEFRRDRVDHRRQHRVRRLSTRLARGLAKVELGLARLLGEGAEPLADLGETQETPLPLRLRQLLEVRGVVAGHRLQRHALRRALDREAMLAGKRIEFREGRAQGPLQRGALALQSGRELGRLEGPGQRLRQLRQ